MMSDTQYPIVSDRVYDQAHTTLGDDVKHWDEVDARVRAPAIFDLDANHNSIGISDAGIKVVLVWHRIFGF